MSYSPSQTHNSSCSSAHTPDNPQAPDPSPDSQSASRSGTRGRTAAAAACQVGRQPRAHHTPSVAVRSSAPAAAAAQATEGERAWEEAIGAAEGIAEGIAVAGRIARWGLGGRRGVGLRRLRRAIGGIAAWGLWLLVYVGD